MTHEITLALWGTANLAAVVGVVFIITRRLKTAKVKAQR